jgi:type I restriction enzyme S subunit
MSEWKEYILSDVMDIIGGGTPKTSKPDYWGGNIPWLSVVDFGNENKFVEKTEKNITELGLKNSSTKILRNGQIIISARGTVGELAVIKGDMAFNQSCYGLSAKESICNNDYLYYLLKCKIVELKRNAHGAVFDTITRTTFDTISAIVPDLPTQTAIAEILSSLDDKIELNNKINQELETLAQTLFKQWFIDFEFPNENGEPYKSSGGEMVDSELGEIPKGWELGKFGDLVNIINGYAFKSKDFNNFSTEGIIKIRNINGTLVDIVNTDFVSPEVVNNLNNKFKIESGEILIAMTGAEVGKIGVVAKTNKRLWLNQRVGKITPKNIKYISYIHTMFNVLNFTEVVRNEAMGSAQPNISSQGIENIKTLIPEINLINNFSSLYNDKFRLFYETLSENQELTNLRDTLLPKLISGELEINETTN